MQIEFSNLTIFDIKQVHYIVFFTLEYPRNGSKPGWDVEFKWDLCVSISLCFHTLFPQS